MSIAADIALIVGMTILLFWGSSLMVASFDAEDMGILVRQRLAAFGMFAGFVSLIYFWG